ncbi:MAG: TolC family outer membrane protein [Rhodobacteraceae bacterium]|nr:TolC family outer membrane protein [Paracoccaceae bacterium]
MNKAWKRVVGASLLVLVGLPAAADTLTDAMRLAYETNPTLILNRAALRATDESVALARSGRRPQIALQASGSAGNDALFSGVATETYSASLNASLNLYDGGRSRDAVEAAKTAVLAARASMENIEQSVMLSAAQAFLTVRRDQQIVSLARNNVDVLKQQLQAAEDRLAVGAATRTEVAQTRARMAAAQAVLAANRGALAISAESYIAVVGTAPVNLAYPPRLPDMPGSLAAAEEIALRTHPLMRASHLSEKVAAIDMRRARNARLPSLTANVNIGYRELYLGGANLSSGDSSTATLTLSQPIYTGGRLSASIRQAGATLERRMAETSNTRAQMRQQVSAAWYQLQIARASISATRLQIEASQFAFEGVTEEARLGASTVLDTLNAKQEVLTAQNSLIKAMHDERIAAYSLLSAMGLLTPDNLDLGIELYDPSENFNRVQNAPIRTFEAGKVLDNIADRWE